jgi:hypothetical protein
MTARGFGKRDGAEQESYENMSESKMTMFLSFKNFLRTFS